MGNLIKINELHNFIVKNLKCEINFNYNKIQDILLLWNVKIQINYKDINYNIYSVHSIYVYDVYVYNVDKYPQCNIYDTDVYIIWLLKRKCKRIYLYVSFFIYIYGCEYYVQKTTTWKIKVDRLLHT